MTLQDVKRTIRRNLTFAKRRLDEIFIRLMYGNNNTTTFDHQESHNYLRSQLSDSEWLEFLREERELFDMLSSTRRPI